MRLKASAPLIVIILLPVVLVTGCATLREIAALRHVDFVLDRVSDVRVAGVLVDRVDSYDDLSTADVASVVAAVREGRLPLELRLHVRASNPEDNVQARLVRLAWTLLIRERETVSGVMDREVLIPPGEARDVPVATSLDLLDFFDGSARDLVEIALDAAGRRGLPRDIALRAEPTVETPLGPIRYPEPIIIEPPG